MKNIYDLVRQKEAEIAHLQKEIEALRVATRLLAEASDPRAEGVGRLSGVTSGPVATPSPSGSAASAPALSAPVRPATPSLMKEETPRWEAGSHQSP